MRSLIHAKTYIQKYFKTKVKVKQLKVPSKNKLYLVNNKYLLKIFHYKKEFLISCKEYLKTYDREIRSIELFSRFKEISPIILKYKGKKFAWIFKDYAKGKTLKEFKKINPNHGLDKQIMDLMINMHSVKTKIDYKEIKDFYIRKIIQVKKRLKTYLPEKYQSKELYNILAKLQTLVPLIVKNSKSMLHGDFVDRNIIVNKNKIKLIDFENSRQGPGIEDLIFYVDDMFGANGSKFDKKIGKKL